MDYLLGVIGFLWISYFLEGYINWRQLKCTKETEVRKELQGLDVVDEETFKKTQSYTGEKLRFGLLQSTFDVVEAVAFLYSGVMPTLWGLSTQWLEEYWGSSGEISISLVYSSVMILYSNVRGLPFGLWRTFVIEKRYGFNQQTLGGYFLDIAKGLGLSVVLGAPLLSGLIFLLNWGGEQFWVYVWLFMVGVSVFLITIKPIVIDPLFNKYEPLPAGSLRSAIEDLVRQVNFPMRKLFVVDGSTRSAHSNAYFFGFWRNKRIVLFDTLMKHLNQQEIISVLKHEIGHWYHSHSLLLFFVHNVYMLVLFYLASFFINDEGVFRSFGFYDETPKFIGLLLFDRIFSPADHILQLLVNMLTRKLEYQADAYAKSLDAHMGPALIKLHLKNLGNLCPDPLYSMYYHSHPTLVERLAALQEDPTSFHLDPNDTVENALAQDKNE